MFVTPGVVQADDAHHPHTLSHELAHVLLPLDFPEAGGGPECEDNQIGSHHPAPYNVLFCTSSTHGERTGGPKRFTRLQQIETRSQDARLGRSILKNR